MVPYYGVGLVFVTPEHHDVLCQSLPWVFPSTVSL